ncbi:MAG: hypothetical protein ACXW14_10475, partial [Burkholderiaceae bacterium]
MAEDEGKPGEPRQVDDSHELSVLFGLMIWAFIGAIFAWNTNRGQAFLRSYWWVAVLAIVVLLLLLKLPAIDAKLKLLTLEARTGLIVFVGLPVLVLLVTGIVLLHEPYRVVAIRGVFLAVVVLLPATMYYLFIVTRKDSLLNEYIAILDRLGLTRPDRLKLHCEWGDDAPYESLLGPRLRVETYLQRFEAAYGPIGVEFREEFIDTLLRGFDPSARNVAERPMNRRSTVGFTEVFNLATAVPVIVATALIALGWLMVLPPIPPDLTSVVSTTGFANAANAMSDSLRTSLNPSAGPVGFAFLGAYFFALQVLFRRYVRRDLRASAYVSISIRIVLAVIGTWVVVECAKVLPAIATQVMAKPEETLNVIGFVLGVFPQVAWQFVRKVLSKVTLAEVALPSLSSQLPLSDLDGLTVWHESRFEEEDIENIANMATADLSDLMLNTRIARGRIIDWVDQAMLYVQIGPVTKDVKQGSARDALRAHGIRSATSLLVAYDQSLERKDGAAFEQLLGSDTDGTRQRVRSLVDSIVTS